MRWHLFFIVGTLSACQHQSTVQLPNESFSGKGCPLVARVADDYKRTSGLLRCNITKGFYSEAEVNLKQLEKIIEGKPKTDFSWTMRNMYRRYLDKYKTTGKAPTKLIDGEFWLINPGKVIYPKEALRNQERGYVRLMFTINREGEAENIEVTESEPLGVFDAAAISSVKERVYIPRVIDGEALPVPGVMTRLDFYPDGQ